MADAGSERGRAAGKVVIITGAASGLGRADAERLAAEGARLLLTDINGAAGAELADALGARFLEQDVGVEESWQEVVATALAEYGRLDGLVNNAGIAPVANVESESTAQWREVLRVHLDGTFFGCRAAIPAMAASGGGSIVNMSSTAALVGLSPYLSYSAAKGGIRALTKSVAMHCREQKNQIRCNSVHPGSISTPMVHKALETLSGYRLQDEEDPEAAARAMGIGEPLDVANMVLYLISDEGKHINGAEIVIDNADTIGMSPR